MRRRILALATVTVLAAGCVLATSASNVEAPSVDGALVGPVNVMERPSAQATLHALPVAVEGQATSVGTSTPESLGRPAASESNAPNSVPPGRRPPCPTGHHLGIACILP